jgi:S-adenosylmethionine hydrolase
MAALVTLLTDFGTADGYVAEMKGVLLSAAPQATVVDASHDIPPQDIEIARLTLARYWRRFPVGTVHVAIVDPGVGGTRAAIAVESEGRYLLGPDNGILSPALLAPGATAITLPVPVGAAPTFHGRDVFAPAAAALANGSPFATLGAAWPTPEIRRTPAVRRLPDGRFDGEVIAIDRFGNALTNLLVRGSATVELPGWRGPVVRTYADVAPGALCALAGSTGLLEIAQRDGSAAVALGLVRGARVSLTPGTK